MPRCLSSWFRPLIVLLLLSGALTARAFELTPTPVADGVYALIGPTGARRYDNHGFNIAIGRDNRT